MEAVVSLFCVAGCALGMLVAAMLLVHEHGAHADVLLTAAVGVACLGEMVMATSALASVRLILAGPLPAFLARRAAAPARPEEPEIGVTGPAVKTKYGNNRLPDFARESILAELQRHMRAAQPWLKIDLTLGELAAAINVSPHHLSQIINSEFGKSFACYINEYRVGEACKLLAAGSGRSVLDVALESGFSSKSSFNASFKKHTGMTPSEFRKASRDKSRLVA